MSLLRLVVSCAKPKSRVLEQGRSRTGDFVPELRDSGPPGIACFVACFAFPTADAVDIRNRNVLPQLACLEAGQLPEVKTVLEQQNAIELVPIRHKGCDRDFKPFGSEVQRESL